MAAICSQGAATAAVTRGAPAPELAVGGLTRFTTIDYPGQLAAVVYVQGCPWRCAYCHNPQLRSRGAAAAGTPSWAELRHWLTRRVGLIDAVVFSGGEPTLDAALPAAMAQVKALGFRVGLHSAGIYPQQLAQALAWADWVGLDIKAPLSDPGAMTRITGVAGAARRVRRSLAELLARGVDCECRTTAHPALLDDAALQLLADELAALGVRHYALQICRPMGGPGATPAQALPPVGSDYPSPATLAHLQRRFAQFTLRRDALGGAGPVTPPGRTDQTRSTL